MGLRLRADLVIASLTQGLERTTLNVFTNEDIDSRLTVRQTTLPCGHRLSINGNSRIVQFVFNRVIDGKIQNGESIGEIPAELWRKVIQDREFCLTVVHEALGKLATQFALEAKDLIDLEAIKAAS